MAKQLISPEEIYYPISQINWLGNLGKPLREFDKQLFEKAESKEPIEEGIQNIVWENFNLEGFNRLQAYLNKFNERQYAEWNGLVKHFKTVLFPASEKLIQQKLILNKLPPTVLMDISYNVLGRFMESYFFENTNKKIPRHFIHLYGIYEQGHLPFGWTGKDMNEASSNAPWNAMVYDSGKILFH